MGDYADMALSEIMDMDELWERGDFPSVSDLEDGTTHIHPFAGFSRRRKPKPKPLPWGTVFDHPCPDCGASMVLRDSKYGPFYGCTRYPECRSTHGAHRDSRKPLGTPANKETKQWRIKAHDAFDTLWRDGGMTRPEAYRWLQEAMGMPAEHAHIGRFGIDECKRVIAAVAARE